MTAIAHTESQQTKMDCQQTSTETPGPAPRMCSPDRSQADPTPKRIDELIPEDHPARMVWEFTLELDLGPLYRTIKSVEGYPGRPPIDPAILVALWIYATIDGISSARELDKRCYDCDPYKWLRGGVDVNYHTLADFRVAHKEWLEQQIVQIVATLRMEGLIDLNKVGQDGMRVRASAGSSSFKKEEKLNQALDEAQDQWNRLQHEFEGDSSDVSARQLAARKRAGRERLERIQRAKEELEKVAAAREARKKGDGRNASASTTDPEARRMKMADGGFRPAYNVQFATTLDTLVITGVDLINAGSDGGQMEPMIDQIETQQNTVPKEYYTDGGFSTVQDIENIGQRGVVVYTPVKEVDKRQQEGKDPYAPQPRDKPKVAEWRQRMGTVEAQEKYKQRCKCEWSNAQCRNRSLQQFLVRGLEKVKSVVLWYALTHNLLRMVVLRAEKASISGGA